MKFYLLPKNPGLRHACGVTRLRFCWGGKIMNDQSGSSKHEVADYISTVAAQLALMAASQNYTTLTHLLEMAWLEAEQLCGRDSVSYTHLTLPTILRV